MSAYGPLARWYDAFTRDVPYAEFTAYYESLLRRDRERMTILDLCCGTGSMTLPLALRGHELIGVDASPDMLARARARAEEARPPIPPLFLCQDAAALDLYGTVEAALCGLDGLNYLSPEELPALFGRLHLFLEPGGVFAFDVHSPAHLRELDGCVFADETDGALCLWRGGFDAEDNALYYAMDIFSRAGALWRRDQEEHVEYAHAPEALRRALADAGFAEIEMRADGPQYEMGRRFFRAVNLPH